MRITIEVKQELEKLYNENVNYKEIIEKLKISKAQYYRIIKDIKEKSIINKSINKSINENLNTSSNSSSSSENTSSNSSKSETETETETENETENENINENDNENDNETEENNNNFDKEMFKKELNNISIIDINNDQKILKTNNDNDITIPLNKKIVQREKTCRAALSCPRVVNKIIQKESNINNISNINNKSNIIETIKNCNTGPIEEIKEKRSLIIIIRQYINVFTKELINIYLNKSIFEKRLFTLTVDQLKLILENIRIELNLNRNKNMFINVATNGLRASEQICKFSGYDVTGLTDELLNDPDFIMDLQIITVKLMYQNILTQKQVHY